MTLRFATLLLGLCCLALPARAELVLGVHPFKPATQLTLAFTPLAELLSEALGQPVTLRIPRDYSEHVEAAGRGEYDIAYLGPSLYVKLREAHGPQTLLARQQIGSRPVFHSKIFVRADSPVKSLTDLAGRRFAFGSAQSTMGHYVPRHMLWQAGITVDRLAGHSFINDHVNVTLGVLAGEFDAGAVKEDVFFQYEKRGLRAIATSKPISDHLLVAGPRLSTAQVQRLREALLRLHESPRGRAALQAMTPGITALVMAQDSDYDSLRAVMKALREQGVRE